MEKLHLSHEVELANLLRRCEQSNHNCEKCVEYLPARGNCTLLSDAAFALERLSIVEKDYGLKNTELEIKLSLERFHRDCLNQQLESMQNVLRKFAAIVNADESIIACEYCKKQFRRSDCNCLKDFEWREAYDTKEEI